ncbi:putative D-amino acid dehydrogenase [Chlamydia pneumoniae TW-183]|uniref:D-amino acid dehydrogenase n=2 Tax=Chlamydia pneumoniae TaxID=83558 RepID=Q9Z6M9_CHLPN|nr:FAD-dependent oxidoreductase [Chlamydia pneumoniae]AAD19167.1 predicted D-amino acid dehyrogenase [Chlamydia pneumoniae CWL029]AAF73709.1 oxidoreductase, DadA family [Chlamydia pneumoniae AR39]AAP98998.1 putative D-amino acid dehydrogenase [Chlamydia pneumoniae TW-183]CRI33573.1 D-amino acid dehydrogenase [Chlamydia pneumoniae]CRI36438.1 D-amino acid dehydrogenase [Chlamydia pneumoniae]
MRIAVLGAGYAGLSVTWHLLLHSQGTATIDLFDPIPLGEGASGMSSGLLHAFTGKKALKPPLADQGINATHALITEASKALNVPIVISQGILRPAIDEDQAQLFTERVEEFPKEVEWWEKARCEISIPSMVIPPNLGALFIKSGVTLNNDLYIQGLADACMKLGTQFYDELIEDLADIEEFYDHIIVTPGANASILPELKDMPVNKVKGQLLEISWPKDLAMLSFSINAHKYMVANTQKNTCILGATFEHNQPEETPDPAIAYQEIMPPVLSLFPGLKDAQVLHCYAGMRSSSKSRLPVISRIREKLWFLGGLGSKGLLYHGITGDMLAQAVLRKSTAYIAKEFLFTI